MYRYMYDGYNTLALYSSRVDLATRRVAVLVTTACLSTFCISTVVFIFSLSSTCLCTLDNSSIAPRQSRLEVNQQLGPKIPAPHQTLQGLLDPIPSIFNLLLHFKMLRSLPRHVDSGPVNLLTGVSQTPPSHHRIEDILRTPPLLGIALLERKDNVLGRFFEKGGPVPRWREHAGPMRQDAKGEEVITEALGAGFGIVGTVQVAATPCVVVVASHLVAVSHPLVLVRCGQTVRPGGGRGLGPDATDAGSSAGVGAGGDRDVGTKSVVEGGGTRGSGPAAGRRSLGCAGGAARALSAALLAHLSARRSENESICAQKIRLHVRTRTMVRTLALLNDAGGERATTVFFFGGPFLSFSCFHRAFFRGHQRGKYQLFIVHIRPRSPDRTGSNSNAKANR